MKQQLRAVFLYVDLFAKENCGNSRDFLKSKLSI
jgi:hypothetical protein